MNLKKLVPLPVRSKIRERLVKHAYNVKLPELYAQLAQEPVDPNKIVFIEYNSPKLSNSLQLMYDTMEAKGFDCEFVSLRMNCGDFAVYSARWEVMVRAIATARLVFICEAVKPLARLTLRPETKVIQLWHGCGAFKKFGMSTADKIFGGSRESKLRNPAHKNTSLVTVSSPEVRWAYIEAMQMEETPEVVQALGVSRTDVFFDEGHLAAWRAEAEQEVPAICGRRVMLYAPTFRGRVATATAPDYLDVEELHERLGDEWVLLVKHHPHVKERPPIPQSCESFAFDVSSTMSIEAAMVVSDVCVSDYSSLVFEYSLLNRPMAFLAPDIDEYDDWRGFYYDYDELTPGPVLQTTTQLADWVDGLVDGFDDTEVAAFRHKFMSSCDGHATERIIAAALGELPHAAWQDDIETCHMSVIVPVYNASASLQRTIDSLDAQSAAQESFQVVLVNDGSTDNSLELCQGIASSRPNYVVLDQPNKGVSAARNAGMRVAKGRYILFLDADDALSPLSIQGLVTAIDRFGDSVDLVTYPLRYHYVETGEEHVNPRYGRFGITGVYDLSEYPFVAQTNINVCIRNRGPETLRFVEGMRYGEDQVFNTLMLCGRHAIGYCAEAEYTYFREPTSATLASEVAENSFEDVAKAWELFLQLAHEHEGFARYAYALILYNVGWRIRENKLYPDFGDETTRRTNYARLASILHAIPYSMWEESPHITNARWCDLLLHEPLACDAMHIERIDYGKDGTDVYVSGGQKLSLKLPSMRIYCVLREPSCLRIKGVVFGVSLPRSEELSLSFDGVDNASVEVVPIGFGRMVQSVWLQGAWAFDAKLPAMDGKAYDTVLTGKIGPWDIPAFDLGLDMKRTNGRRIGRNLREFGDRRLFIDGCTFHVGTIKGLPSWTMPVVTKAMRVRDKMRTGSFDATEVHDLRGNLPAALAAYDQRRVWLYVDADEALEHDRLLADHVERLAMDELPEGLERVAAYLGAERVVFGTRDVRAALPCDWDTYNCVADFTRPQTYEYVFTAKECESDDLSVVVTVFDTIRAVGV